MPWKPGPPSRSASGAEDGIGVVEWQGEPAAAEQPTMSMGIQNF